MLQHVGLSWIIDNNNHLKFDIDQHCAKWMKNSQWNNTTVLFQLSGQKIEDFFKTGYKDRYELLCSVDTYFIIHSSVPDYVSSSGEIQLKITSSADAIESLGHTINFIYSWIQCFSENYG